MEQPRTPSLFWAVLLNPLWIASYGFALYTLAKLCQYGDVRGNGFPLFYAGGCCLVWLLVWGLLYLKLRRRITLGGGQRAFCWGIFAVELAAVLVVTGVFGLRIYRSAQNFNGKLSWYLYQQTHTTEITLEADNLYRDGVGAMVAEWQDKLNTPETLYVLNSVQIQFDPKGDVTSLYAFLGGQTPEGAWKTYLIDYDASQSDKATVWLDGYADRTSERKQLLMPMAELLERVDLQKAVAQWPQETEFALLYYGARTFPAGSANLIAVSEDGTTTTGEGPMTGYEVSLFVPGQEERIPPQRYFCAWKTAGEPEQPQQTPQHTVGVSQMESGEDVSFYLSQSHGYCLRVMDAAAGSRFYQLEETHDGGETWSVRNEDPFLGNLGSGVDLVFWDEAQGFLLLPSASGSYSRLFRTEDGGDTFGQVELPETGEYDFPNLPFRAGEVLKLKVSMGSEGDSPEDGIVLVSQDQGVTWRQETASHSEVKEEEPP